MGILLSLLFSFLAQSIRFDKKVDNAREKVLERQHLQLRLQDILMGLTGEAHSSSLYTQSFPNEKIESLVVNFDNGIDLDPSFSGKLIGRLFLDEKNNLSFVYWPEEKGKESIWRQETLLSDVSSCTLSFLNPDIDKETKSCSLWLERWPKEKEGIPSIIRMAITQKDNPNDPLHFAFRLPQSTPIPTWL